MVNDVRREKAKRMLVLAYRKSVVLSAYMPRVEREERLRLQRYNNFSEYANYFTFLVIYIWLGISAYRHISISAYRHMCRVWDRKKQPGRMPGLFD